MHTMRSACIPCLLFGLVANASYRIDVVDRSLMHRPLLAYNTTSWAPNTLNAAWLPLPGNQGGGAALYT